MNRILAVDDNETNLALLQELLGDDYELVCVLSGEAALESIRTSTPDLVLLDVMMPGMDGYETCRQIRNISSCRKTRVLLLSAKDRIDVCNTGNEAGADDCLSKPFDSEDLLAKVRVHLRMKAVEEANEAKSRALDLLQHGLESPLGSIFEEAAELLDASEPGATPGAALADSLATAGNWLQGLLAQCERFSLMKTGQYPFSQESLDLCQTIQCVIDDHHRLAVQRKVEVVSFMPHAATAPVDRTEFSAAISALIEYAIGFAPRQGSVSVYLDGHDEDWRIVIADNGHGLIDDRIVSLFEPFADRESVLRGDNDGLSLAIARQTLRAHHGDIRVIQHADYGAAFEITLPREAQLAV